MNDHPCNNENRGPRGYAAHENFAHPYSGKTGGAAYDWASPGQAAYGRGRPFQRPKYNVPLNIAETESAYEVYVYAFGFEKENIKIMVTDDQLHISGTRPRNEENPPVFSRQEFPVRIFERVVGLNKTVDKTAITARQSDGVLIVTLPKTTEAQTPAQEISVE